MRFEPILDLFYCPSFPSLKLELQFFNEEQMYQIDESHLQRGLRKLGEVAMDKSEKGIAGDAAEEIVLGHLLLDGL